MSGTVYTCYQFRRCMIRRPFHISMADYGSLKQWFTIRYGAPNPTNFCITQTLIMDFVGVVLLINSDNKLFVTSYIIMIYTLMPWQFVMRVDRHAYGRLYITQIRAPGWMRWIIIVAVCVGAHMICLFGYTHSMHHVYWIWMETVV